MEGIGFDRDAPLRSLGYARCVSRTTFPSMRSRATIAAPARLVEDEWREYLTP